MLARYRPDDLAPYVWISVEEAKRFDLALYKVYSMVSRPRDSVTGAVTKELTANEPQFPMPKNNFLWNTASKEVWLSACPGDLDSFSLDDALQVEWISNSAELIGLFG